MNEIMPLIKDSPMFVLALGSIAVAFMALYVVFLVMRKSND